MSETEVQAAAEPVVLEYGRYRLLRFFNGEGALYRARDTCETCSACGCGEQAEHIEMPSVLLKMMLGEPVSRTEMLGMLMQGGGIFGKLSKAVTSLGNGSAR